MGTQIKLGDIRWYQYLDSAQLIVLFRFLSPVNIQPFPLFSTLPLQFVRLNRLVDVLVAKVLHGAPTWYLFGLLTTASYMRQLRSRPTTTMSTQNGLDELVWDESEIS